MLILTLQFHPKKLNLRNVTRGFEHTRFEIAQEYLAFILEVSTNEIHEFSLSSTFLHTIADFTLCRNTTLYALET